MEGYKNYRKKNVQPMRPFIEGEDTSSISINPEDMPPRAGGMVATNPSNPKDQWYVAERFFLDNYEEVK